MGHEGILEQALTAGKGDTALGAVKLPVRQHRLQKGLRGPRLPQKLQGPGGAQQSRFPGPFSAAAAEADARLSQELHLGRGTEAFGIMAPLAAKGTALHEYGGPDPRAVMDRESLDIEYHPGVEGWFERINRYAQEAGVQVEHYVLSSGLKEIIEGTSIAKYFTRIYACEFLYKDGQAYWPKMAVNYTNKTQFVYRINKGVLDINNDADLNNSRPDSEKRVFFSNMIYIGDGLTDVPCMKLVKQSGGHSIAIYSPGQQQKTAPLLRHGRVEWMFEADYREGSELDKTLKLLLQQLAYYNKLKGLNEQQKKEFV
jgi:hypothetical protein